MELGILAIGSFIGRRYISLPGDAHCGNALVHADVCRENDYGPGRCDFVFRAFVIMCFGILMTCLAVGVDFRTIKKSDYAFWLYIFGVMAFWLGLTAQDSDSELPSSCISALPLSWS